MTTTFYLYMNKCRVHLATNVYFSTLPLEEATEVDFLVVWAKNVKIVRHNLLHKQMNDNFIIQCHVVTFEGFCTFTGGRIHAGRDSDSGMDTGGGRGSGPRGV